jgi:serine O-acetyltransferase
MIKDQGPDLVAVSAIHPDWSREMPRRWWDPGRRLLRAIRRYQFHKARRGLVGALNRRYWAVQHLFWSTVTQCDIPINSNIGGGLMMTHPNGIVIHPAATIGPNCLVFQQVTIGANRGGVPVIGGHVDIGAGAKIIGGVTIGDHALIGVNAVVLSDVPPGGIAVGVPARVIRTMEIVGSFRAAN